MLVAYIIVIAVLGVLLLISAAGKLRRDKKQIATLDNVGVPPRLVPLLAAAEIAGAIGLVAGIAWIPLGIAASIGSIVYFVGAIVAHLRIGDTKGTGPAAPLLALGIASLALALGGW